MKPLRLPIPWLEWLAGKGVLKRPHFLAIEVPESPDNLLPNFIFHEVRGGYPKWLHFKCPRCGEHIQLQTAEGKPKWTVEIDWLNRPTIAPSIWEKRSCRAHFFVRRGELVWARD